MGRSDPGLTTSTSEADITNQSNMRSNLRLVLFGLLGLIALSAVLAEPEEESLSQDLAVASRVARSPEKGRNKMGKKKKGKNGLKGRKLGNKKARGSKRKGTNGNDRKAKGGNAGKGRKRARGQKRRIKNARGKNPRGQKKAEGRTTVSSTCFESAVSYMKMWKDIVGNFERQVNRMTKQNKTGGNKSGKKGAFAPTGHRLVDIGGGNRSNLSCGGQYGNSGAAQLQNLTDTLFDCETTVNASCNPANIPQPNFTMIQACQKLMDSFSKEATTCLGKTTGKSQTNSVDACTCWSSSSLSQTAAKLKFCKANNESKAITAALKNCTTAFQKCRKFEDAAGEAISSCASDSSKLIKKAANLAANNASMTAAKTKMSSLATARNVWAAAAASCAEIITISQTISKISITFPQSPMITAYAKKISSSTVNCTTPEKASLLTEVTAMETAIASVNSVLTTIQEQIQTLTGSTASTTQLDAENAVTSTAAPAGRRDRIRRLLNV